MARDFTTRGNAAASEGQDVDLLLPIDDLQLTLDMGPASAPLARQRHETALDLDMTSPMPVDFEPSRRAAPANSDFLDLPEMPTGPGRLGPRT